MPDWLRYLSEMAVVVIAPLLLWNAQILLSLSRKLQKHDQTLYGEDGNNGLKGTVRELVDSRADHQERLRLLEGQ